MPEQSHSQALRRPVTSTHATPCKQTPIQMQTWSNAATLYEVLDVGPDARHMHPDTLHGLLPPEVGAVPCWAQLLPRLACTCWAL